MRLARFWFIAGGRRIAITQLVGTHPDYAAQAVMFLLRHQHGVQPREARLITGRFLPVAA